MAASKDGHTKMQNGTNGAGLRVALTLFVVLAGIATALGGWSLANTIDLKIGQEGLKTRMDLYHPQ